MGKDYRGGLRMLHARRKRLEALAEQEAAGATFWTDQFDGRVRTKVWLAYQDCNGGYAAFSTYARDLILRDEGLLTLCGRAYEDDDLHTFLMTCDNALVPTVVEAMSVALGAQHLQAQTGYHGDRAVVFGALVKVVLREHRVSFDIVDDQMVEFSSREMHVSVVEPALTLLAGDSRFSGAETAYQDALGQISASHPSNAITDAGTALQEVLTALGCSGNALGPLIRSARASGLLAPHDSPMLDAIERILSWVSADRSESGDAHAATQPTIDDAWLTVHIVGAVVLRLAQPGTRGATAARP